jgi:uncharacterized membrane protein YoaT (DUF817 family)
MEVALNLGWFVIASAVFAFSLCHLRAKGESRNLVIACIALACVVCLLFPVVSMTDDLNSGAAMPEATKFKIFMLPLVVTHLFSFVACVQERIWATLSFEQEKKPAYQERLSFDLSRRPPPAFRSLLIT